MVATLISAALALLSLAVDAAAAPLDPVRNLRVILPGGSCNNDRTRYCDGAADCATGARCDSFLDTYRTERFHPYFPRTIDRFKAIRLDWHGKRTAEACQLWRAVSGQQSDRLTCVLGAQGASLWTATEALDCPLWSQAPCSAHGIDVVAIAPYFGYYLGEPSRESTLIQWIGESDGGLGKLFQEITQGGLVAGGPPGGAVQEAVRFIASNPCSWQGC